MNSDRLGEGGQHAKMKEEEPEEQTMSQNQEIPPETLESFRLWECGRCQTTFATKDIDNASMCPECGSKFMAAWEEEYDVVRR